MQVQVRLNVVQGTPPSICLTVEVAEPSVEPLCVQVIGQFIAPANAALQQRLSSYPKPARGEGIKMAIDQRNASAWERHEAIVARTKERAHQTVVRMQKSHLKSAEMA